MGRQPTSGYCQTCRRRRVKCGRERPACQRCTRSGYVCQGYDLSLRMEHHIVTSDATGQQQLTRVQPAAPRVLALSGFREQIAWSYFYATFNWAPFWRPFLRMVADMGLPAIDHDCALAIAYGFMGNTESSRDLQLSGRQLFLASLSNVRTLLQPPVKRQLARLTFTVNMLGMYAFAVDGDMGMQHHGGITHIIQHCSPEFCKQDGMLPIYRICRALQICQALGTRSKTFLDESEWKTVPWGVKPKTAEDKLWDILADLPALVKDVALPERRPEVGKKVVLLLSQLHAWRWRWNASNPNAARRVTSNIWSEDAEAPLIGDLLSTSLEFDSLKHAIDILNYNGALLYLMQLHQAVRDGNVSVKALSTADVDHLRQVDRQATENPLLLPDQANLICQPAIEVLRMIPFISGGLLTHSERSTVITFIPFAAAYWTLMNQSDWKNHMAAIIDRLPVFKDAESVFSRYRILLS